MKLENLEVGMKIKNYKKLCELMEEPDKNGASKRAQVSEWERYVSFERQGNAYIIKEIRDVPLTSKDGRKKYMQYVEPLLLHYMSKWCSGDRRVEHTFSTWCTEIGLISNRACDDNVTDEYQVPVKAGYKKAEPAFSVLEIQRAKYEITNCAKKALINVASSLEKKGVIFQHPINYVVENVITRQATDEEDNYIENANQRVLASMNLGSKFPVNMSPRKQKEFYERLNDLYRAEKGWTKTYTLYAIKILDDQAVMRYANADVEGYSAAFKKEALGYIRKKLADEAEKGNRKMLEAFERFGEGDTVDNEGFTMTEMTANGISFLVEEML